MQKSTFTGPIKFTTPEELKEIIRKRHPYVSFSTYYGYGGVFLDSKLYSDSCDPRNCDLLIKELDPNSDDSADSIIEGKELLGMLFNDDLVAARSFIARKNDDVFSKKFFPAYGRVVNLSTGIWEDRTPEHIFTWEFNSKTDRAPLDFKNRWIKIAGSEENYLYLQRLCGYLISGENPDRIDIIYDPSSTFKLTILKHLQNILGRYCIESGYETLEHNYNVRLAFSTSNKIPTANLSRTLSGNLSTKKPIIPIEFRNMAKILIVVDSEPEIDFAEDLTGKIHYLELPAFNEPDLIRTINPIIEDEHFLEWCIEGAKAYYSSGLNEPTNVRDGTRTLLERIDSVYRFCCKEIIPATNGCEPIKYLHKAYQDRGYDEIPISRNQFSRKVRNILVHKGISVGSYEDVIYGINLV